MVKEIILMQNQVALVDDDAYEHLINGNGMQRKSIQ